MADLIFVALTVGFFAVAVGLVRVCDRIVGGADVAVVDTPEAPGPDPISNDEVAA